MTIESVPKHPLMPKARDRTTAVPFNSVPAVSDHLLQVKPGVDAFYALSQASALESCVMEKLGQAIADNNMDATDAALCYHALDTAIALRFAIGAAC